MKRHRGFTLVELLVVISIIGLLSTIVISALDKAHNTAKYNRVQADFRGIKDQIGIAESDVKILKDITGSGCTDCAFSNSAPMTSQNGAMNSNTQAWLNVGFTSPPMDPWGSPYTLDENEHEFNATDCRTDLLASAGPDGTIFTSDDIVFWLPHVVCP